MSSIVADPTLYIGKIPIYVTEEFLWENFKGYGVETISLEENDTGKIKFAFLTFAEKDYAQKFLEEFNYSTIDTFTIHISWADSETEKVRRSGEGNLIVKNLHYAIGDCSFHDVFSKYGEIISCKISRRNGRSNGYGFVQFRDPANAESAKSAMNGCIINGRQIRIENYKRA
jgi:polyadenylate-binding protein